MYHNVAVSLLLLSHDEQVAKVANSQYFQSGLVQLVTNQITREHIVAQTPNWSVTSHGFIDDTDYQNHLHMLGNLTLLSKSENARCSNQPVHTKITDPTMYGASMYAETRQLSHQYASKGGAFNKTDILGRTQALTKFVMSKWAIW